MTQANDTCPAELPNWCAQRHSGIFWILIIASVAMVAANILSLGETTGRDGMPFFSANDRSRWITVRSLVEHGSFEIDRVLGSNDGKKWDTIDKVRHVGRDGQFHYYSSKPPLLSLVIAGLYGAGKKAFGWEIATETSFVVRSLLLISNLSLWLVYLYILAKFINSIPVRDWTRYFVLACAGFATFLGSFAISLNNHLPAAVSVMIALYCTSEVVRRGNASWVYFAGSGLFSALAVANEFPSLACLVLLGCICIWQSLRQTVFAFVPMVVIVFTGILVSHWFAWGQWLPAYAQRSDGKVLTTVSGDFDSELRQGKLPDLFRGSISKHQKFTAPVVEPGRWPGTSPNVQRWVVRDLDPRSVSQISITAMVDNSRRIESEPLNNSDSGVSENDPISRQYELRQWANWYDYPGSYWLNDSPKKSQIDQGEPSALNYAFHLLFGHHGLFLLTPIWLLSFAGMIALAAGAKLAGRFSMRWLGLIALVVSIVVIAFYLSRPETDRNYGGVCSTPRWLLWLSPIWLATMLPVVDWLGASRFGRFICFALLLISGISALYHADNPWTFPWVYQVWQQAGLPN